MMLKTLQRIFPLGILLVTLASCTWVKVTEQGENVRLATVADVTGCSEAGSTRVSVLDRVAGIGRSQSKMSEELAALARNSAAQLGGDTIVPVTDIVDGAQTFAIYKCRQ